MTYLEAAEYAKNAAGQADAAAQFRNNNEPDRAFECLSMAVFELSRAVAELARANHKAG
jgi:hypothetical protein